MEHSRSLALAGIALLAAACGESVQGSGGEGGHGATTSTSSATGGSGGAGGSAPGAGGGDVITCDDLGFCGEPGDPGCVACAISEGSCQDEYQACADAPDDACRNLLDCLRDCDEGEDACVNACNAKYPQGTLPLSLLLDCVFCDECRVSCNIDPADCTT